jgi:hypothetical protein
MEEFNHKGQKEHKGEEENISPPRPTYLSAIRLVG